MSAVTLLHLTMVVVLTASLIVVLFDRRETAGAEDSAPPDIARSHGRDRLYAIASIVAALSAVLVLATGLWQQRAFENTRRRAIYFESYSAGLSLDRVTHWGLTACMFAVACALVSDRVARKTAAAAGLAFLFAALVADAIVHARVPTALAS
jgi:hypothetical protein